MFARLSGVYLIGFGLSATAASVVLFGKQNECLSWYCSAWYGTLSAFLATAMVQPFIFKMHEVWSKEENERRERSQTKING